MTTAVDYDHTVNWSQFHTFQLAEGTKDPVTFTQKRIEDGDQRRAHRQGLAGRGVSNPDILVYTHVVLSQREAVERDEHGRRLRLPRLGRDGRHGDGHARPTFRSAPSSSTWSTRRRTELVWRGTASDQVSGHRRGQGQDPGRRRRRCSRTSRRHPANDTDNSRFRKAGGFRSCEAGPPEELK